MFGATIEMFDTDDNSEDPHADVIYHRNYYWGSARFDDSLSVAFMCNFSYLQVKMKNGSRAHAIPNSLVFLA